MISILEDANKKFRGSGENMVEVFCLSTDTKPTSGMQNGFKLTEIDTGKEFRFDGDSSDWVEVGADNG